MAKPTDWTVRKHGPLEQLADNLWWVTGTLPRMSLTRNMVIARRTDGTLVIHNGIALDDTEQMKLDALGRPAFLLVPNGWHRLDAPAYKARYPQLRVFTPAGSRDKAAQVVTVDGTYDEFPHDDAVRLETLHGVKDFEGAMVVRSSDGVTVVLTDAVFNMDKKADFFGNLFTRALGSAPGPRVSRLMNLVAIRDKAALRADLERYAALPDLQRVIVAHEKCASGDAARGVLVQALTYL